LKPETQNIRPAQPADFDQVFNLIRQFASFLNVPEKVHTSVAQMMEEKESFKCLVAVQDEHVIGFATYFFAYYSWSGKAIYLDDLYVSATNRGQGIGIQLLDKVIEIGKNENCKKMRWQVSDWNQKAIEFYKRRGAAVGDGEINCDLSLS